LSVRKGIQSIQEFNGNLVFLLILLLHISLAQDTEIKKQDWSCTFCLEKNGGAIIYTQTCDAFFINGINIL